MTTEPLLGQWWEPHDPVRRLFGTLDQLDGLRLRLMGSFAGTVIGNEDIYALHGELRGAADSAVTLLECSGGTFGDTTLDAILLVRGAHLPQGWNTAVSSISGSSKPASRWLGRHGANQVLDFEKVAATIEYRQPDPLVLTVDDSTNLTVSFQPTFTGAWENATEIGINQQASFSLRFLAPVPLGVAMERLERLNEWLTLWSGWSVYLEDVRVEFADPHVAASRDPRGHSVSSGLVRHAYHMEDEYWPRIRFAVVAENVGRLVAGWFAIGDRVAPLIEHWRAISQSRSKMPLQYQFQALCAAVESAEKAFDEAIARRTKLRSKLTSFLNRSLPAELLPTNLDGLVSRIVKSRNWYTHFSRDDRRFLLDDVALANASQLMFEALEFELLRWCGLQPCDVYPLLGPSAKDRLSKVRDLAVWHRPRYRGEPQ